jgi:tRNA(Ile)-lysidine synthase TilS/MesJ
VNYAETNKLKWNEDSTNKDTKYRRNHIRHKVLSGADSKIRTELQDLIKKTSIANEEIDSILKDLLNEHLQEGELDRHWLVKLPHNIGLEVIATWLRQSGYRDFDRKTLERLLVKAKVAKNGSQIEAIKTAKMVVHKDSLQLVK